MANERSQLMILVGLSLGVMVLIAAVYISDHLVFQKILGKSNPILVSVVTTLLGGALLFILLERDWFAIYRTENPSHFLWLSAMAALLAAIMILVDLKVILPEDLNVSFPNSLLFYPAVGYGAEILFHVLPLAVFLFALTGLFKSLSFEAIIWPGIFIVALLEPIYQTLPVVHTYPSWASAYIAFHLFCFNMIQLVLFKRFDFVSMYSFRLVYYFIWHIVWGYIRTRLLF